MQNTVRHINLRFKGSKINILLANFLYIDATREVLVVFNGAVNRDGTSPPYFSGVGISSEIKMPVIAFSDPSLNLSDDLTLGWYAGFLGGEKLPNFIARFLDRISKIFNLQFILIGGSGGGFACLGVSKYLKTPSKIFIWNPQTSISNYGKEFVVDYIENAFPGKNVTKICKNTSASGSELYDILSELGLEHDLTRWKTNHKLLYFQNKTDGHLISHLGPFCKTGNWIEVCKSTFFCTDRNILLVIGDWGIRHAPPPKNTIVKVVKSLRKYTEAIMKNFHHDVTEKINTEFSWIGVTHQKIDISIESAKNSNDQFIVLVYFDGKTDHNMKCAFYLYADGQRIIETPYQDQITFKTPGLKEKICYKITAFAKDDFGNKVFTSKDFFRNDIANKN